MKSKIKINKLIIEKIKNILYKNNLLVFFLVELEKFENSKI
jgi:hypothetical protein